MKRFNKRPGKPRPNYLGIVSALLGLWGAPGCAPKFVNPNPADRMYRMKELNCRQVGHEFTCDLPPGSVILDDFSIVGLGLYQAREDAIVHCAENLIDCQSHCVTDR